MKKTVYKIYGFVNALKYPKILGASLKAIFNENVFENEKHIRDACDFLLYMQNSDGGYSRKFSFISGRDSSYIETTGYIIPSLIEAGKALEEKKYINSALKAAQWLLSIQNRDGSFSEIDTHKPYAFDTGQCLIGLNYLYEYTQNENYLYAAKRAAYWLKEYQEEDGSWQKVAYNVQKHSYYTRVASAMYKYGILSDDAFIKEAALKNIEWVLSLQESNGYFQKSSFLEDMPAYLHTLIYVLEGLLDIYEFTQDQKILDAIVKNSENFKIINLERDLILCSQYNKDFECVNSEKCMTGIAQWAGVALRIYALTKDESYKNAAIKSLFYLKAKQLSSSVMNGGFSASMPFWGDYGSFDFVNWTNKFFIDSMLLYKELHISKELEQETFVGGAFRLTSSIVTDQLSYMDKKYLQKVREILPKDKKIKVLDLGCGKGVIIALLKQEFHNIEFFGIDPLFEGDNIKKGSAYKIDFEDDFFDIVMSFEVLQHTYLENALREIYRVSKSNAKILIGERNPYSLLGLLKPLYELSNRWMYPYDSPFKERWYGKTKWYYYFGRSGFDIVHIDNIEGSGKKFVNRYFFIEGNKR